MSDMPEGFESVHQSEGWGAKIIDRRSHDLKAAFPETKGFSVSNLKYILFWYEKNKQLTQRTPNELTPPEFVLVRTSSLFYSRSFMNRMFMADFAQECSDIKIGQQPADHLPWFHIVAITKNLPKEFRSSLPSIEEIEAELRGESDE